MSTPMADLSAQARILARTYDAESIRQLLDTWRAAELAVAASQEYTVGPRSFTRADAAEVRSNVLLYAQALQYRQAVDAGEATPGGVQFRPTIPGRGAAS